MHLFMVTDRSTTIYEGTSESESIRLKSHHGRFCKMIYILLTEDVGKEKFKLLRKLGTYSGEY